MVLISSSSWWLGYGLWSFLEVTLNDSADPEWRKRWSLPPSPYTQCGLRRISRFCWSEDTLPLWRLLPSGPAPLTIRVTKVLTNRHTCCLLKATVRTICILDNKQLYWQGIQFWNANTTGRTALWGIKLQGCQWKPGPGSEKKNAREAAQGFGSAWFLCYNCKCILERKQWQRRTESQGTKAPPGSRYSSPERTSELLKWAGPQPAPGDRGWGSLRHGDELQDSSHGQNCRQFAEAEAWLKPGLLFNA